MDPVRLPIVVRAHLVNSVKVCSCSGFGSLVGWMVVQQNRWVAILALVRWELVIWEIYLVVRSCMGVCVCMWLVGEVVRM